MAQIDHGRPDSNAQPLLSARNLGKTKLSIAALAASLAISGCSRAVTISEAGEIETPMHKGAYGNKNQYYSAHVFLDNRWIAKAFKTGTRGDYVLISAKASLPTVDGPPLIREFPLFTIEDGVVSSHKGVDLFHKYPISANSRDQVSIILEVTYLKNEKAMKLAKDILKEAEKLAEPYLANYPLATDIISSAKPLIDRLAPTRRTPQHLPTSARPEKSGTT